MHTHLSSRLRLGGALARTCLALIILAPVAAHAQSYTLTDLGNLPGVIGGAGSGVNDSGQVAGSSLAVDISNRHAFVSGPKGTGLTDLGTLGGTSSVATGINDSGQVAGSSDTALTAAGTNFTRHAFLTGPNGAGLTDLGTLPGYLNSEGNGVNISGQVVGVAYNPGGVQLHAFLSGPNGGVLQDLGTLPGGIVSYGIGVNNTGQVTGYSSTVSGDLHAILSGPNGVGLTDLGTLPGDSNSAGYGVNTSGQVVGASYTAGAGHHDAFLSGRNGVGLTDLGTLGGTSSGATGINDSGQVVGYSTIAGGATRAFVFSNGVMTDLNTLIMPGSGFTLVQASGISNTGFITGSYENSNGRGGAFLLTPTANPVPEASSVVSLGLLLLLGLGGMVVSRRRKADAAL